MNIKSIRHWDSFVYGLLYPGFVGSMIYELVFADKENANIANYESPEYIIQVIITFFYCADYLHLYGDMHEVTKDYKRDAVYLWCDVLTSIFFFAAFVAVKLDCFTLSLGVLSAIPVFFTIYKLQNRADRNIQIPYATGSIVIGSVAILCEKNGIMPEIFGNVKHNLLLFAALSFAFYLFYVLYYYDAHSYEEDKKIYGYKSNNEVKKESIRWRELIKGLILKRRRS
jgi:hypothetical protein